jgi:hypothetical protein
MSQGSKIKPAILKILTHLGAPSQAAQVRFSYSQANIPTQKSLMSTVNASRFRNRNFTT